MPRVMVTKRRPPVPALPDRPSRLQVLWRRQRRRLWRALALGGLAAAGFAAVGAVHAFGDRADVGAASLSQAFGEVSARLGLRVRQVIIEGREKTPDAQLRAAIGVSPGDPLLAFSLSAARARIEAIQWVREAEVERRLPDRLVVRLIERRPFAVWQHDGKYALIDRAGGMVTDSAVETFADQVLLVVGPGAPGAAAGLIDALAAQPDILGRVAAAVRVGERRWNLRLKNGADILLPEGGEVAALGRLAVLQAKHAVLNRPVSVDLRLFDRLVIRPLPGVLPGVLPDSEPTPRKPT